MNSALEQNASARLGSVVDGKYELLSVLGVGGMGSVYEALHRYTDRKVALKLLHPRMAKGVNMARFLQEAKAAARIDHPRIALILDAGQDDVSGFYLAMELFRGADLGRRVRRGGLPVPLLAKIGLQTLEALEAAHARDFVHRDIKPANIFLIEHADDTVDVRLLDFGVARRVDSNARRVTQAGGIVGTPYFMSPEQMCGEAVDGRADLWALGVVMFYSLTGALPFRAENYPALLTEMLRHGPPSLLGLRPNLSADIVALAERSLSPRIEDRFATAAEMASVLRGVLKEPDETARIPLIETDVLDRRAPAAAPTVRLPAREEPPRWASALDEMESEISNLSRSDPEPEPETPSRRRRWRLPWSRDD